MSYVKKIMEHLSPMQTEKSHTKGKWKMPETQTSFLALSVNSWVGISRSASETDDRFYLHHHYQKTQIYRKNSKYWDMYV